jgi:8-oxo-dGTP pyrophosphatase MutT (NUDIX family)
MPNRRDESEGTPGKAPDKPMRKRRGVEGGGVQYAALPYRLSDGVEILLVTSRDTGRWVLPKGWPMKGKKPYASAAQEAVEEAGISGKIGKQAIGSYRYGKRLANGAVIACVVHVFPLPVKRQKKRWSEQGQRTAHWFAPAEAAAVVHEPDLAMLIEEFAARIESTTS